MFLIVTFYAKQAPVQSRTSRIHIKFGLASEKQEKDRKAEESVGGVADRAKRSHSNKKFKKTWAGSLGEN